jgi:hypothetical protein
MLRMYFTILIAISGGTTNFFPIFAIPVGSSKKFFGQSFTVIQGIFYHLLTLYDHPSFFINLNAPSILSVLYDLLHALDFSTIS